MDKCLDGGNFKQRLARGSDRGQLVHLFLFYLYIYIYFVLGGGVTLSFFFFLGGGGWEFRFFFFSLVASYLRGGRLPRNRRTCVAESISYVGVPRKRGSWESPWVTPHMGCPAHHIRGSRRSTQK